VGVPVAREGEDALNPARPTGVPDTQAQTAEAAFEAFLAERYGKLVGTMRLMVGDHATAEDIAQESFARAYIHWAKLWPDGNPGGWVHRVATNLAMSMHRRAGRELRAITRLGGRREMVVEQPDVHPELQAAVANLPRRQRAAVSLHYLLGLPVDETAEAMGCRPGTVKSLLFQARSRMRDELGEDAR
jgi:RNA polymerase sigma factor (sigma-70 family)